MCLCLSTDQFASNLQGRGQVQGQGWGQEHCVGNGPVDSQRSAFLWLALGILASAGVTEIEGILWLAIWGRQSSYLAVAGPGSGLGS